MVAPDRRRTDIARFLDAVKAMRIPAGSANARAIWVILASHGTKEGATRACNALWDQYVSVNEFRVAKVTEIAEIIEKHVKNDAMVAATQARGFLRTYFSEWQMVDPAATESKPPHELKKYLSSLTGNGREIALALALHYCRREIEEEAVSLELPTDGSKPKKRPERELTASANRIRLLFSYSAHGTVMPKEAHAGKAFVKWWAYKPLAALSKVARASAAKKKAVRVAIPKKATAKKAPVKRMTLKRGTSKKSSRR